MWEALLFKYGIPIAIWLLNKSGFTGKAEALGLRLFAWYEKKAAENPTAKYVPPPAYPPNENRQGSIYASHNED